MVFKWFNLREAADAGNALADQVAQPEASASAARGKQERFKAAQGEKLRERLVRAAHEIRTRQLNFFKRAWFANSFKWRLLEHGVDAQTANEWTQTLVLEISSKKQRPAQRAQTPVVQVDPVDAKNVRNLSKLADEAYARGAYAEAITNLDRLIQSKPRDPSVLNRMAAALSKVGRFGEAEDYFRKAIRREPNHPEAHGNLGALYLARGQLLEAEGSLRRAMILKPAEMTHRSNLGLTLVHLGRLREARVQFDKVLRVAPRHAEALVGMGLIARTEGRFDEAASFFDRALKVDPKSPVALAALVGVRRMTSADHAWLERAEGLVAGEMTPAEETTLRFAVGKYCNDVWTTRRHSRTISARTSCRRRWLRNINPKPLRGSLTI